MTSTRKFYRTLIEIEVLSEEPYDPPNIRQVAYDIQEDCSGAWRIKESQQVDGPTIAQLLIEQGSSPEFFYLDDQGNDLDDGDEDSENNDSDDEDDDERRPDPFLI